MSRFAGRRAVITGAGSGIGQATVGRFLDEGAFVCAADRSADGLADTAARAERAGTAGRLRTAVLDVSDERAVAETAGTAVDALGGLDVLVNAAGILRAGHTHEFDLATWNLVLTVNLTGTFLMTRAALPALLESPHGGVLVNFSSTSASFAHPYMAAYAASKGGIQSFTHAVALEYAKQRLRAVSLAPGGVTSGMTGETPRLLPPDTDWSLFTKLHPVLDGGAMGDPEHVASIVAMAASDDGSYLTGTEIRVDGGTHL